ncbi:DNA polymerase Y family protein [Diplocloster agilis]|uniref:DNA polymerase Y family protein n=1 Tax=Diplocloster agilis TaxID=2850323 RepID=UPI000AB712A6|nr:DNA polymerase IV [Suonthocola fibrivorans]MCU6732144.1 DNA polymerase IV [Suonthocola fibrivorans]
MDRIIFHIDVNSAYLSWTSVEHLKNGDGIDLRDIPAIIGGDQKSRHGVVLAKSGPAKVFHVRTGEPVVDALRKCPNLVIEPPDHHLYHEYSRRLMELLSEYSPDLEQVSVDECYMDFSGMTRHYASPVAAATSIKDRICSELGFTVNIGISINKLLAKMASDFEKPNRVHTLFPQEIPAKMWPLPVEELFMVGRSSAQLLHKLEILTIGDLARTDPALLTAHLKSHGRLIWEYANGIDDTPVIGTPTEAKGIGNSTTLPQDVTTLPEAQIILRSLSESVSERLRNAGQLAGMVSVEIKYSDFTVFSHQAQLRVPSNTNASIYECAGRLFGELWNHGPIRLLGIRTSKLVPADTPIQISLFDLEKPVSEKQKKLDAALDQIRRKYGNTAVVRGSLMERGEDDGEM